MKREQVLLGAGAHLRLRELGRGVHREKEKLRVGGNCGGRAEAAVCCCGAGQGLPIVNFPSKDSKCQLPHYF